MEKSGFTRRIALCVGGLAVVGMGLTVGCSAKQSPAPTEPVQNTVESKLPANTPAQIPAGPKNSFAPSVKAPAAATAQPGDN